MELCDILLVLVMIRANWLSIVRLQLLQMVFFATSFRPDRFSEQTDNTAGDLFRFSCDYLKQTVDYWLSLVSNDYIAPPNFVMGEFAHSLCCGGQNNNTVGCTPRGNDFKDCLADVFPHCGSCASCH